MAVLSLNLKLDQAAFFFVNEISVTKAEKTFEVDTSDVRAIRSIIRGIIDNSIDSNIDASTLKSILRGNTGGGGGENTGGGGDGNTQFIPVPGPKGDDGKSAYEIALEEGYKGTKTAWIKSLKGEKGDKGDKGDSFEMYAPDNYLSAYLLARDN